MGIELDVEAQLEEERLKYTILAGQPQIYAKLFPPEQEEENLEWITPKSEEEAEDIVRFFEQGILNDPSVPTQQGK
jgi:hypothetical protein